ncbi:replication initiation protein [Corynebacterium dentalis]|uniref:replication initiation protein n=1 Tax=Corynebacterium dentalis TaxID=2014528 RepID=UPI000C082C0B|nr:replication initiation protein [Corynebacterium dentalis]
MSLPKMGNALVASQRVPTKKSHWDAAQLITQTLGATPTTLGSFGVTEQDRQQLIAHLGRKTLQGSPTRDFKAAWRKDKNGHTVPKLYRVETAALGRCQYVALAHKQRSAVLVVDIDRRGHHGGTINCIDEIARQKLSVLAAGNAGPAWIGVNPINGKCQLIWMIDPVYTDERGDASNARLLRVVMTILAELLGGDPSFSHRLSRSPFYTGDDPTAYRWHVQHHRVDRLAHLRDEVRTMTGQPAHATEAKKQNFSSGRELIEAVRTRREQAQQAHALLDSLKSDLPSADALDGDRIDGVKVLWVSEGRAARDETAFRHALAAGHRLREAGERMTDAKIIDAYERAYNIAQAVGADNREPEMPPQRDRVTMARRVRGYVMSNNRSSGASAFSGAADGVNARERKALATMGRRGGQKAAERWNDRDSEYVQNELEKLNKANKIRKIQGQGTRARVLAVATEYLVETGDLPAGKEIAAEVGITKRMANLHLKALKEAGMLGI